MVEENDNEDELLSPWEKTVSKKLEKLDSMEKDIAEIKKLVSKPELAPARVKLPKPAKATVKELIKKSIPFLGDFNVDRFIELAQKEGLVENENYNDQDIALLNDAIGEPLFILDEAEREDAIKKLSEKLKIDPSRFETIAEEESILLPVDNGFYDDEAPAKLSKITVIEQKVSEEEMPEEE